MVREITREELHAAVWSKAVVQVAKDMGVSDVAVAKACRRINVPLPPRGYWAKKRAGSEVSPTPLPKRPPGGAVSISLGLLWQSPYWDKDVLTYDGQEPVFDETMAAVCERIRRSLGEVFKDRSLTSPHPVIEGLLEEDRRRAEFRAKVVYFEAAAVPIYESDAEQEKLLLISSILKTAAAAGYAAASVFRDPFEGNKPAERFTLDVGDRYGTLTAKVTRSRAKERRTNLTVTIGDHVWENPQATSASVVQEITIALIADGEESLRAQALHKHRGLVERREKLLRQQCEKAVLAAKAEVARMAEAAQMEAARRAAEEEARVRHLMENAEAFRKANDIRAYVQRVREEAARSGQEGVEEWAQWALGEADKIDPTAKKRFLSSPHERR